MSPFRAATLPKRMARASRTLVVTGAAFMAAGLVMPGGTTAPARLISAAGEASPLADRLAATGILLLLAGPAVGLIIAGGEFFRRGDRRMALLVFCELLLLALGAALGSR